jgi:hypothetical protein
MIREKSLAETLQFAVGRNRTATTTEGIGLLYVHETRTLASFLTDAPHPSPLPAQGEERRFGTGLATQGSAGSTLGYKYLPLTGLHQEEDLILTPGS